MRMVLLLQGDVEAKREDETRGRTERKEKVSKAMWLPGRVVLRIGV